MTTTKHPETYTVECDLCEITSTEVSERRPTGWTRLIVTRGHEDFHGVEVAGDLSVRDFCESCGPLIVDAINAVKVPMEAGEDG